MYKASSKTVRWLSRERVNFRVRVRISVGVQIRVRVVGVGGLGGGIGIAEAKDLHWPSSKESYGGGGGDINWIGPGRSKWSRVCSGG